MPPHSSRYYGRKQEHGGATWENARKALGATKKIGKKKKYSNTKWKLASHFSRAFGRE